MTKFFIFLFIISIYVFNRECSSARSSILASTFSGNFNNNEFFSYNAFFSSRSWLIDSQASSIFFPATATWPAYAFMTNNPYLFTDQVMGSSNLCNALIKTNMERLELNRTRRLISIIQSLTLSRPTTQNVLERRSDESQRRIYARGLSHIYALSLR